MSISRNLITNIVVFGISSLISIFLTPFLVKHTSLEMFGAFRTALLLPTYFTIISLLISGAVSRYLTIALNKNDIQDSSEIFSTSFFTMIFLLLFLIPISIVIVDNIDYFLNFPKEILYSVKVLFLAIIFTGFIQVFSNIFTIPAFARNRLDVQNYKRLTEVIIQTLLIIILILNFDYPLESISIAFLASALIGFLISIYIWKKFSSNLILSIKNFKFDKLKDQLKMGGWLVIDHLGVLLFLYIDLLLVNYLFGAKETGEYAIAQQWQTLLRTIAPVLAGVLTPLILIYYSKNKIEELKELTFNGFRYLGICFAIIGGIFAGYSESLLRVWLGEEYTHLSTLMIILILPMCIALSVTILFPIQTAYNKLRIPALVTILCGLINLILAFLLVKYTDLGIYGIAIAGGSVFLLRNLVFTIVYTLYLTKSNIIKYYIEVLKFSIFIIVVFIGIHFIQTQFEIKTWINFLLSILISTIVILPIVYTFLLSNNDKKILNTKVRNYFEKN